MGKSGIENKSISDFRCLMIVRRENWPELTQKRPTHKPDLAQKDRPANRVGLLI